VLAHHSGTRRQGDKEASRQDHRDVVVYNVAKLRRLDRRVERMESIM
jgi:hypothetical protein